MRTVAILAALGALTSSGSGVQAQVRVETVPGGRAWSIVTQDPDRPRLGITTRSSGRRDTLGLLVESVTRGSPAEQAGIEEGDRLVSVNGVNLRLSREDAGEPDMEGIATRRLTRELAKHDPGDEVELQVYRDGQTRTIRAKTVAAEDLMEREGTFTTRLRSMRDRVVLGLSLGGTGSRRDTLGVLVVGVSDSSPAALAGIEEGDRIAAINGVDLRVAREDAGDIQASRARINRLNREMEKVEAGNDVELRVFTNGQTRTVRAKAVRASDLPRDPNGFYYFGPSGFMNDIQQVFPAPGRIRVPLPKLRSEIERQVRDAVERARSRTVDLRLRAEVERRAAETMRRSEGLRRALQSRILEDGQVRGEVRTTAPARRASAT
jgi:S1-C subfamily serine protease